MYLPWCREGYYLPWCREGYYHHGVYPTIPTLGIPCIYTTHPVPPGTLSPLYTVPIEEALGSNLGYTLGEEVSAPLSLSFLL